MQVLTFDFHNTLVTCNPWFDLEVRGLPWAVIELLDIRSPITDKTLVDRAYRQIRLDVIASGNEIDAYDAVSVVFEDLDLAANRAAIRRAVDQLILASTRAMAPVPGAVETVQYLRQSGVKLGIVSSAVHHLSLGWMLDRLGIASCFDTVVSSASSGYYKSTPAIYEAALARLDGDARTSVHVGDSLRWDVATAQQAGMIAVWLQSPRRDVFTVDAPVATPSLALSSLEGAGPTLLALLERLEMCPNA